MYPELVVHKRRQAAFFMAFSGADGVIVIHCIVAKTYPYICQIPIRGLYQSGRQLISISSQLVLRRPFLGHGLRRGG